MDSLFPPKLKKGELIGVIAPASPPADPTRIQKGVSYLEKLGYLVVVGSNVQKERGYLAGTDEERAADLHAMFGMKEVRAIICLRGGYGSPRLLPLIDYTLIGRNPKIFVGYSDITALQLAFWKKCRLVTFQGPMAGVEMAQGLDSYSEESFWRMLTSASRQEPILFAEGSVRMLHRGKVRGALLGGNLSLIVSILGTPYQPDFRRAVLCIEEVDEEPYRVDRMLTQLRNASVIGKSRAILAGQFTDCVPSDSARPSLTIDEILEDVAARAGVPFLAGLPFGHAQKKMTLPIGARVGVDAGEKTIAFLEPAVH